MKQRLFLFFSIIWFAGAFAQNLSDKQLETYQTLINETRCVTCQHQNIAESNAPVAESMRELIYTQVEQGKSSDEIRDYLIERYGEFVSFKPSFSSKNYALWLGPWLFILLALGILFKTIRRASS